MMRQRAVKARRVIVVGAPRSGTNIVRDVLTRVPGIGTWPCDEINYVWRVGDPLAPTDVREPADATPRVRRYIERQFERLAGRRGLNVVIEKTCANCVRLPFVDAVMPGGTKYIHLIRDGRDAVPSAVRRWNGGAEGRYLLRKLRFVPKAEIPHYAFRFFRERSTVRRHGGGLLPIWGPRVPGLSEMLAEHPLHLAVAYQWRYCVEAATSALQRVERHRRLEIRYEDFVSRPASVLRRILRFIGGPSAPVPDGAEAVVSDVHAGSVGRGKGDVGVREYDEIEQFLASTLKKLGYL